jgi:hypothetical protein
VVFGRPLRLAAWKPNPGKGRKSSGPSAELAVASGSYATTGQDLTFQHGQDEDNLDNRYVTAAGRGLQNGSDWNNAFAWSSLTFVRGLTYYLADGSYGSKTISTATSGTQTITIKKATAADHGTSVGWISADGDGQATISGSDPTVVITTGYITIDGRMSTVEGEFHSTFGFRINGVSIRDGGNNAIVRGIEFASGYSVDFGNHIPTTAANGYIGYCKFHGASSPSGEYTLIDLFGSNHVVEWCDMTGNDVNAFRVFGTGHTIRDTWIHDIGRSSGVNLNNVHPDGFQTFGDNGWVSNDMLIERVIFSGGNAQPCNLSKDGVSGIDDWTFRNCLFYGVRSFSGPEGSAQANMNIGMTNVKIHNCTFYDCSSQIYLVNGTSGAFNATGLDFRNNIVVGMGGDDASFAQVFNNTYGFSITRQYNFFARLSGAALSGLTPGTGEINGGTTGFVDAANDDLHITSSSSARNAGTDLSATGFSTDYDGNARSTWDIGAYEYV